MRLTRRAWVAIGSTVLVVGIASLLLVSPWQIRFEPVLILIYIFLFLSPVKYLYDTDHLALTIPYLVTLTGALIILHTILEGDRKPSRWELLEYLFPLVVLFKDHNIWYSSYYGWELRGWSWGPYLIMLDGFFMFALSLYLSRLVDRPASRRTVFWVYFVLGFLILANGLNIP